MAALLNPRLLLALAIAVLATIGVAAYALAEPGGTDDGVFAVELRDGGLALEEATLPAGPSVIEASNAGTREHEITVVRTRLGAAELPVGLHGVSISQAGELVLGEDHVALRHEHPDDLVLGLRPGQSRRFSLDGLRPGSYVVFCQTDNHYLAGERAGLRVVTSRPTPGS